LGLEEIDVGLIY